MRYETIMRPVGEDLGPVDWAYDFDVTGWDKGGSLNPRLIAPLLEQFKKLESGEWMATTDGGWPRVGWKKVLKIAMYDGWPYWKPVPSVLLAGTLGCEWYSWCSITEIEPAGKGRSSCEVTQ